MRNTIRKDITEAIVRHSANTEVTSHEKTINEDTSPSAPPDSLRRPEQRNFGSQNGFQELVVSGYAGNSALRLSEWHAKTTKVDFYPTKGR